jgi:hypothetical protein
MDFFTDKQKYACAILESKALTDQRKIHCKRLYENTFDAQALYTKLFNNLLKSTNI